MRLTILTDVRGVCQFVCHAAETGGGACSVCHVLCVQGHLEPPLPNVFGLLLSVLVVVLLASFKMTDG